MAMLNQVLERFRKTYATMLKGILGIDRSPYPKVTMKRKSPTETPATSIKQV